MIEGIYIFLDDLFGPMIGGTPSHVGGYDSGG